MCMHYMKLKSNSQYGVKYSYVPCGECAECRAKMQYDWQFRIKAEFMAAKSKGWNVAFMTLTYTEQSLPKIPKCLFKTESEYKEVACFSRKDVSTWITKLRDYCKYHYQFTGENALRYFVASEYGEHTHRPHYHAILAWPASVSYEVMHKICTEYWTHGILFPRDSRGDHDMLPFAIVGDPIKAFAYISKYVCKDLTFINVTKDLSLNEGMRLYKDIQPFHVQNRSFGYEIIKGMSDTEKYNMYVHGHTFEDGRIHKIPLYFKNKLIFDNDYIVEKRGDEYVRLVRRKANEFFAKYKAGVFVCKVGFYEKMFNEARNVDTYIKKGIDSDRSNLIVRVLNDFDQYFARTYGIQFTNSTRAEYYLAYYGVDRKYCKVTYSTGDRVDQWYARYSNELEIMDLPDMDECLYKDIQAYFSYLLGVLSFSDPKSDEAKVKLEQMIKLYNDFFNNVI